jgi:uncharacterized protein
LQNTRDIGPLLRQRYGGPVRKVCLRLGTTCPNRDGTLDTVGCSFCAEHLRPTDPRPVTEQLAQRLARLQPGTKAIAYLQDHTATHMSASRLDRVLSSIRRQEQVVAVHIGTRPDCLAPEVVEVLARHAEGQELLVELGLQSVRERTLELMGRKHDVHCFCDAVERLQRHGLQVCAHVVLGLPTDRSTDPASPVGVELLPETADDAAAAARLLGDLGVEAVKIHHCHVLRGTPLARLHGEGRYEPPDLDGYLERLVVFLEHLPATVEIHRLVGEASAEQVLAPAFTADKRRTYQHIRSELQRRGVFQGALLAKS